jgi:hypothetical protein
MNALPTHMALTSFREILFARACQSVIPSVDTLNLRRKTYIFYLHTKPIKINRTYLGTRARGQFPTYLGLRRSFMFGLSWIVQFMKHFFYIFRKRAIA